MHPLYANAGNERRDVPIITTRGDRSAHRDAVAVSRVSNLLADAGGTISLALEGVRNTWDVRHWWREYVVQSAFLVSVTLTPVVLIAIPLGATISLQKSEEHTSELQSLMRISYAVFCLKKKKIIKVFMNVNI